jgi:tyrosine-protein kinase Etk/Wzc
MLNTKNTPDSNEEIDLLKLLFLFTSSWKTIVGITLLFMVMGTFYALVATPIYQVDSLLQVEQKSSGMPGLGDIGEFFETEASAATEIELIKSRMVLNRVIDKLHLDIKVEPKTFPLIGSWLIRKGTVTPSWAKKMSYVWAEDTLIISRFVVPLDLEGEEFILRNTGSASFELLLEDEVILSGSIGNTLWSKDSSISLFADGLKGRQGAEHSITKLNDFNVVKGLKEALNVAELGKKTGILSIRMTGPKIADVKSILDEVTQTYFLDNVKRLSAEAEKTLSFLKEQLPEVETQLRKSEDDLNTFQLKNGSVDLSLETKTVLEQMVNVDSEINQMIMQEAQISKKYTKEHPTYLALTENIQKLQQEKGKFNAQVKKLPESQQEFLRLSRELQVNQEIYVQLLNKIQELEIVRASTVGNVRIIDNAEANPRPIKPKKPLIVLISLLIGFLAGASIVFVKNTLNKGVESANEIEEIGVNVYASIPFSELQDSLDVRGPKKKFKHKAHKLALDSNCLAISSPEDLSVEAIRSLRTSLHFSMLDAKNNVLMISGPGPGVGKSFLSANLAAVCAMSGQRILLVDADLRKGHLHDYFNVKNDSGLSGIIADNLDYNEHLHLKITQNLDFISRGDSPPNPAELLMHERFINFVADVQKEYDLVIIDTPPILAVTDPAIVGRVAGTTLLTFGYGKTALKEIEMTIKKFEQAGVHVNGGILNGVKRTAGKYGDYRYENYQYKYGNDYQKKS